MNVERHQAAANPRPNRRLSLWVCLYRLPESTPTTAILIITQPIPEVRRLNQPSKIPTIIPTTVKIKALALCLYDQWKLICPFAEIPLTLLQSPVIFVNYDQNCKVFVADKLWVFIKYNTNRYWRGFNVHCYSPVANWFIPLLSPFQCACRPVTTEVSCCTFSNIVLIIIW